MTIQERQNQLNARIARYNTLIQESQQRQIEVQQVTERALSLVDSLQQSEALRRQRFTRPEARV